LTRFRNIVRGSHAYRRLHSLRPDQTRFRAPAVPRRDRPANCRGNLPGLLGPVASSADYADQSLRPERHGPAGPQLSQTEHAGFPVQIGRRRKRRHVEKGNDSVVGLRPSFLRTVARATVFLTGVLACTPRPASSPLPSSRAPHSTMLADSVLPSLSPPDEAAQWVWRKLYGHSAPASSPVWTRINDLIRVQHVGGFIMSIGSPIETAEKLNTMQRMSALPLVIGADYEYGAGMRQRGGYF